MGVIGNTLGTTRYVDLPIAAGTDPTVTWNTDRVLDLIGIEVHAKGASAAALKVDTVAVAGGAIAAFADDRGSVWAANPSTGVPLAADGDYQDPVGTGVGYENWVSTGTVQSGIVDRTGSVPAAGALTPISAAIASGKAIEVDLTGAVVVLEDLPAADGDGFITLPVGTTQDAPDYIAGPDNLPYRVKASDTSADTYAGFVRLVLSVPKAAPNAGPATPWPTQPVNGIQHGSTY